MTDSAAATSSERPPCPLWAKIIATGGGVGYIPFMPGTWGSLAAIVIAYIFIFLSPIFIVAHYRETLTMVVPFDFLWMTLLAILFFGVGIPAATRFARAQGIIDPSCVVIDEFAGQTITLLGFGWGLMNWNWYHFAMAFVLFRILDIWKPWPIRWFEKLPGGWGIMMDDVVAGIFGAIILAALVQFHWLPGMR